MTRKKKIETGFFLICALLIFFSGFRYFESRWNRKKSYSVPEMDVLITGTIKKPGKYRVSMGATVFELLQSAGIQSNSDIAKIQLARELVEGESLHVNRLDSPVDLEKGSKIGACALDYFQGGVEIRDTAGTVKRLSMGLFLMEGDIVQSVQGGKAQIRWKDKSLIDLAPVSRILVEKIADRVDGKIRNRVFLQQGKIHCVIQPQASTFEYYFKTPHIQVVIHGTEFVLEVSNTESEFKLLEGLATVQNIGAKEGLNMVSGQHVRSSGGEYPLRPEEMVESEDLSDFEELQRERELQRKKQQSFTLLLCGIPNSYFLFKIDPVRQRVTTMHIPSNTWVGNLVTGFNEFDRAFLYGGPQFSMSIAERILRISVGKYLVFGANDVQRCVDLLDGIDIELDSKAATFLKVAGGKRRLNGLEAARFMSPGISGHEDARERQKLVLTALFQGSSKKGILLTLQMVAQGLGNADRNLSVEEAMEGYSLFHSAANWEFKSVSLPGKYFTREGDVYLQPIPERISEYLN